MDELQLFNFKGQQVRTINSNGEPWFVASDVTKILGLSNPTMSLQRLDEDERSKFNLGRQGEANIVNEYGLYNLVLASRKPEAKKFKRWVTHEVLPAIRKHGAYMTDQMIEEVLTNPDTIIKLATQLKTEREGRLIAEQRVNELTPKATYYDQVLNNKALINISVIAKDYGYSAPSFNKLLHELGVQYKQGNIWLLYSKYQRLGWTQSETKPIRLNDGTEKLVMHTKWTQKGRLGLYELLKKHDILPLIEQDDDVA